MRCQKRLSELIEAMVEKLDPTSTSDLSQNGLVTLVWLLCRQKPNISLARLRVQDFGSFNTRLHQRHVTLMENSPDLRNAVTVLTSEPMLTDAFVVAMALAQGFEESWLTDSEPKARRAKAEAAAVAGSGHVFDMMKAAAAAGQFVPAAVRMVQNAVSVVHPSPPARPVGGGAVEHQAAAQVPAKIAPPIQPAELRFAAAVAKAAAVPVERGHGVEEWVHSILKELSESGFRLGLRSSN